MTTIRPSPESTSGFQAYFASRNGLVSRIAISASQRSSGNSSTGETCWKPALGTTTSRRPWPWTAASTACLLPSRVVRSASTSASRRSAVTTVAPASRSPVVMASPMPLAARVTSGPLPSRFVMGEASRGGSADVPPLRADQRGGGELRRVGHEAGRVDAEPLLQQAPVQAAEVGGRLEVAAPVELRGAEARELPDHRALGLRAEQQAEAGRAVVGA